MAKQKEITRHGNVVREDERRDMESRAAVALTEAKTRVVLRLATRSVLWLAFLVLVLYYLFEAARWVFDALTGILLVVVLAIFFAYLIAPLVEFVRRPFNARGRERVMPRGLAIAVVYLAIFGSVSLAGFLLYPSLDEQMTQLAQQAPNYIDSVRNSDTAQRLNKAYQGLPPKTRDIIEQKGRDSLTAAGKGLYDVAAWLFYLPWLVLIPILAFFFLKDADTFRRSALMMLPQGRIRWRGDEFFQDVNSTLAAYIRAQLIACLIIGVACTAAFALIGVRYALVLGVVAGFLEFIPLLGPLVVAVIAGTVAGFDSASKAFLILAFLGALRITQDYVLYPRIIGSGIHLHPLAIILAVLAGHEIAGVAGIFLAIPVIAVLTVTYRHWLEHRGSAGLVAELLRPAETPSVETPPASEEVADATPESSAPALQTSVPLKNAADAAPPQPAQ
ncbi:MAG TPA: AI-2E family transporter [Pyrinomonadaceae bacterium]|nr:AI-2E family transporter [Pyrinomonadaceae bacterium]